MPPAPASSGRRGGRIGGCCAGNGSHRLRAGSPDSLNPRGEGPRRTPLFDGSTIPCTSSNSTAPATPELAGERRRVGGWQTVWDLQAASDGFNLPRRDAPDGRGWPFVQLLQEPRCPLLNVNGLLLTLIEATDESTVVITLSEAIPNMGEPAHLSLRAAPSISREAAMPRVRADFANDETIGVAPSGWRRNGAEPVCPACRGQGSSAPPAGKIDGAIFQTFDNQGWSRAGGCTPGRHDHGDAGDAVPGLRNDSNIELVVTRPPHRA